MKKIKWNKLLAFFKINFLFLWFAILGVIVIQVGIYLAEYMGYGQTPTANLLAFINNTSAAGINVLFMMLIMWFITIVSNRLPVTLILTTVLSLVWSVAEYQVIVDRQEAITEASLQEVTAIGSLLKMMDTNVQIFAFVLIALTILLLFVIYRRSRWSVFKSIRFRSLALVINIVLIVPFLEVNSDNYSTAFQKLGNSPKLWDSLFDASSNGGILAVLNSRTTDAMIEPKKYNEKAIKKLVIKYTKKAAAINATRQNINFKKQTVIYTLSESLTKPSYVPGLTISDDPLSNIDSIMDNTSSGHMVSSGYGGGTAGIEYSTLTGFNITAYKPTITMPYSQMSSSINKKVTVTGQFDSKIVIHPYVGSFYNRRAVYSNMGVNYFYTTDSNVPIKYKKSVDGGSYISDESAYKNVLSKISKKSNSQFIQLLTMQNHTPWTFKGRDYNMIEPTNSSADESTIESYLQGLHYTDEATQTFLDKLNDLSRPITLVWYGDHWPGIFNFVNTTTDALSAHSTPYFIWQNDAAKKANGTVNVSANYADPSDFTAMMMKMNGMKVDAYWALKTEMLEKVPTINNYTRDDKGKLTFLDQQGNKIDEKSLTKDQQEIVNDFKLVQYDITTGKSYLLKTNFFQKVK